MHKLLKLTLKATFFVFFLLNVVVIFHAYKFTHFYEPTEVVQILQQNKTSGDIAKEILFGINAVKQKNIAPDSTYKRVVLFTKDSLQLEAWYTKVPQAKGSVALYHGHGGSKAGILNEGKAFQKLGYNTLLVDFRAHGNSQGNTCTIGYNEAEDVQLGYNYLAAQNEKNIVLYGISLGAAAITKAVADYNIAPQKIILEMPFGKLSDAVAGRVKLMGLPAQPVSTMLTFWGGTIHGFWAFSHNPIYYAKKINCPVLLQKGQLDNRVSNIETQQIFESITSPKKLNIYTNSGHQSLCVNEPEKWNAEIANFLK